MPAGVEHEVTCKGDVDASILYVSNDARPDLPDACRVDCEVSPLLTELIVRGQRHLSVDYELESRDGRVMALLLDEIGRASTALHLRPHAASPPAGAGLHDHPEGSVGARRPGRLGQRRGHGAGALLHPHSSAARRG